MQTIQLRFKDEAYPQVIEALKNLGDIDFEIITEEDKEYLQKALDGISDNSNKGYTLDELDKKMDEVISKHENHSKRVIQ